MPTKPLTDKQKAELTRVLESGNVWIEGSAYVGRAADGVIVQLGNVTQPAQLLSYLAANPNPWVW